MFEPTSSNHHRIIDLIIDGFTHLVYLSSLVSLHDARVISSLHGAQNSGSAMVGLSEIVPSNRTQRDSSFVQAHSNMMPKAGNEWWCA